MRLVLALCLALLALPAQAVQPDEVLDDPVLEARARALSKEIRCLVCRNESIDESNADLARDLRILVRERLVAGDSDAQVLTFLVDRYGEYVLLRPRFTAGNAALWLAAPALLLLGGGVAVVFVRRRARIAASPGAGGPDRPLSPDEQARLDALLKDGGGR
ncbi:cytochrome C biogenesis protein CcdA [Rhodobacteraceae bacterium 2CG4]|uniref:Cytochrome c-type biogenesis protein n=1 Tax=Halovulum marinum TaxID=2662447 RepID=A0A6L5Z0E3_9RHOB|nr:cytochrome c-type biogenesis protein [Halovulum marinum]MSU90007.1 cytochrome C biogenesis protein CcdA [Halovulum marinum]